MKKLFVVVLSVLLSLGAFSVAYATPFYLETAGVTIEVPDGLTAEDQSDESAYALSISVDGNDSLGYAYVLRYYENLAGYYLDDLTDEEGDALLESISGSIVDAQFSAADVNGYPVLICASGDGTELHFLSLLNGWVCDVTALKTDGAELADDEIKIAADLLTSIQFDAE